MLSRREGELVRRRDKQTDGDNIAGEVGITDIDREEGNKEFVQMKREGIFQGFNRRERNIIK